MTTAIDILPAALTLPSVEREQLAADLLDGLEPVPSGISLADTEDIERRAADARAGAPGVLWDEVKRGLAR